MVRVSTYFHTDCPDYRDESEPPTVMSTGVDAHDMLMAQREQMREESPHAPKSQTTKERVLKWFNDPEKIAAIKAEHVKVTIGIGPEAREVLIMPLSPLQFVDAFVLIKEVLVPLVGLYEPGKPSPSIAVVLDSLGENVAKVPKLLSLIIKRGNNVSEDWLQENLCLFLDLQLVIPAFMEQNGLWKLFSGNVGSSRGENPVATVNGATKPDHTTPE